MPLLSITTNQVIPETERAEALKQLSSVVAQMLGKPEQYVMVSCQHNPDMVFAGSDEALAYLELKSIGLPTDTTQSLSAQLAHHIQQHFAIPADRVYIEFADAERHMWGWNSTTFAR